MNLIYDESVNASCPLFVCPTCKAEFFGGGRAFHKKDCIETGYENCEMHYGSKQVEEVKRMAKMFGPEHDWYGISLNMLTPEETDTSIVSEEELPITQVPELEKRQ